MQTIKHLNPTGLQYLAGQLQQHHRRGQAMTASMIEAWAAEVESSLWNDQPCQVEIRARDSVSGAPVVITIPDQFIGE